MELAWTSVWVHGITIRVDFVLVIVWFQFAHVYMCVYACLCFLIMLCLTGGGSLHLLLPFMDVFFVGFAILSFLILFYSSPVLEPNPVLNLAPPIAIVSNKLT